MDASSINKSAAPTAVAPEHKAAQAQRPAVRERKPSEDETQRARPAPPAKPVVNTQGHVTGRHLNVTA